MSKWRKFFEDHRDYTVRSAFYECHRDFTMEELYLAFKGRLQAEVLQQQPTVTGRSTLETEVRCKPLAHVFNVGDPMCECGQVPFGRPSNTPVETPVEACGQHVIGVYHCTMPKEHAGPCSHSISQG